MRGSIQPGDGHDPSAVAAQPVRMPCRSGCCRWRKRLSVRHERRESYLCAARLELEARVNAFMSRREMLAAPLAVAGCAGARPYFGQTTPPHSQRLVHSNGEEPNSLDPAHALGNKGETIVAALLDSLTALHPVTL